MIYAKWEPIRQPSLVVAVQRVKIAPNPTQNTSRTFAGPQPQLHSCSVRLLTPILDDASLTHH
eukprot:1139450-Pelagomonas_calceolata.AAC.1